MGRSILTFIGGLSIASAALAGPNGSIEIFFVHPETGEVEIGVSEGRTNTLLGPSLRRLDLAVVAHLAGETRQNFAAASFYLEGLEPFLEVWSVWTEYAAGCITVGMLFRPYPDLGKEMRRFLITVPPPFEPPVPNCITTEYVELARLHLWSLSLQGSPAELPDDWTLHIVAPDPPSAADYDCTYVARCDYPNFSPDCVTGGSFVINPKGVPSPTPVTASTWSALKGLYKH